MPTRRALKWDLFTPIMLLLEPLRRRALRQALATINEHQPLADQRVLDVGAGTGTLLAEIVRYPCDPIAIEPAYTMARIARLRFPTVPIHDEPAHAMRSIPDRCIDISIVSATLHGFQPEYRQQVYVELKRVTRTLIAIVDYHVNHHPLVAVAEWMEGGDYFDFVNVVDAELEQAFRHVERIPIRSFESVYLAWVRDSDSA